jgi:hypothetical protein
MLAVRSIMQQSKYIYINIKIFIKIQHNIYASD